MKRYEEKNEHIIYPYESFIVRLDGKNFSKFTKGIGNKPFDSRFIASMVLTMNELTNKFCAKTGYTHSDEISLIFPAVCTKKEFDNKENKSNHPHNGRIVKLCSILAGYCSVRFNVHMSTFVNSNKELYTSSFVNKVNLFEQCFDARVVVFSDDTYGYTYSDIVNHMLWRSTRDCYRNAVFTYAMMYFSTKELYKKNSIEMIKMMENKGLNWDTDVPLYIKYGIYCKKKIIEQKYTQNNKEMTFLRGILCNKSFKIQYSNNMIDIMIHNYWPDSYKNIPDIVNISIEKEGMLLSIKE